MNRHRAGAIVFVVTACLPAVALAAPPAPVEVDVDPSPAADLYLKRRPPAPEVPNLPPELKNRLLATEKQADAKRDEAIALLRTFLTHARSGPGRAEGLFKLAELLWEDARRQFVADADRYDREVEKCRRNPGSCARPPKQPDLDVSESEKLYVEILQKHPKFRRTDLVLYLAGFAAREDGRAADATARFQKLIAGYPQSPLFTDAWMMIGEDHFAAGRWEKARHAYEIIIDHPDSPTFDLALFKAAWCDWKLGQTQRAARRFKRVLDLAAEAERSGSRRERRRRAQLRDEALDYLVLVFTEDESVTADDVYQFLASIGGERYSREVLERLAELFFSQANYERSVAAYRYLIGLSPTSAAAAEYQRAVVKAYVAALQPKNTIAAVKELSETYGPASAWAKAKTDDGDEKKRQLAATDKLVLEVGKSFHATAQADEKARKRPNLAAYRRAAAVYEIYLGSFAKAPSAAEARFLRAEILYFKLRDYEAAGDEYLAVGKGKPVGKYHKDALLKAMAAFEKARPKNINTAGRKELLPVDRKLAEATDLYATLFPADPAIVDVIFKNGQLFYDYGEYDEAVKRFGLIVTKYPKHKNAGPAGDRILAALGHAKDYENIETWARKLKKAPAFSSSKQQQRLNRLIVDAIDKRGEQLGKSGDYQHAAETYLRISKDYPKNELAAPSLQNAGAMFEKAKKPERAAEVYLGVAKRYPRSKLAAGAAFAAAQTYEHMAYFDRAADAYELVAKNYPRTDRGPDALFDAGVLRQALGQSDKAIDHYQQYARRYRKRDDAEEVAFRIAVVHEEAKQYRSAYKAYRDYEKRYPRGKFRIEALARAGRTAMRMGQPKRARDPLEATLRAFSKQSGDAKAEAAPWAAEARYLQGELIYRQYADIDLSVKPQKLQRTLDKKTALLEKAQGVYLEVVELGDPRWATAALYRMGSVFEEFASSLRRAPTPAGLSDADAKAYRDQLDMYVIGVEEKAISLYTTGYKKALELGVLNDFTHKLRTALGRMAPSQFPPENEARKKTRTGDQPPALSFIKEVNRHHD